jgi:cytochrome c peroxidase
MRTTFIGRSVLCCVLLCATSAAAADEPIHPLQDPSTLKLDARKVKLGEALFNDVRLAKNDTISCASCHSLSQGGTDGRQFPIGINGQINVVNAPTVYNVVNNSHQFWDGRANTLEDQLDDHLSSPIIFGSNWPEVTAKLSKDAALGAAFRAVYADGIQAAHIREALASYERSLLTPSRFDRYLQGDAKAITPDELAGYKKFKDYGCVACHQGVNVGGNMFQELGVMRDYFTQRGNPTPADLGRYNVTKLESDKHVFKVPSLRNVALTAPYFHDGTALTLHDAMDVMFKYQLGRHGSEADKLLIIKFLNTLSGEKLTVK